MYFISVLTHQGYLIEEQGMTYLAETDSDLALAPLQTAACTYRIALGPRAGQKVLTLKTVSTLAVQTTTELCATEHGFSLHADVYCAAHQRSQLERLCRYITRPAIANERLKRNHAGDVVLQLKSPYQDGTTHIVLSPLEFMQRLAALVPRPRLNLIRGYSTKIHALTDALGNPLSFILTAGQAADISQAEALLRNVVTDAVIGDKGYDSDALVRDLTERGIEVVIPPRSNRNTTRSCDWFLYKERHLVECFFNKIKHYRRVFSRLEKTARNFRGFLYFVGTLIWNR